MSTDNNPFASSPVPVEPSVPGAANPLDIVEPLYRAKVWLRILGIANIVIGAIYALTIIGIIVAWLPIWLGILATGAAAKIDQGFQSSSPETAKQGVANLATAITIMGVLMLINIALFVLYVLFFLIFGGLAFISQ